MTNSEKLTSTQMTNVCNYSNFRSPLQTMAEKAARLAIENHCSDRAMYTGDFADEAIYTVEGLVEDIISEYYAEYSPQKPTLALMEQLAFDLVN